MPGQTIQCADISNNEQRQPVRCEATIYYNNPTNYMRAIWIEQWTDWQAQMGAYKCPLHWRP